MPTYQQRQDRFRDAMAEVLRTQVEFPRTCFVTVVDAKLADDQANANVILSVLPVTAEKQALDALHTFRHDIKKKMAQTLKMRKLPAIHWTFDRTEHKAHDIESYIDQLKEQGEL
jgi:ribosome-binding factor A